jgi:hypothetical protein
MGTGYHLIDDGVTQDERATVMGTDSYGRTVSGGVDGLGGDPGRSAQAGAPAADSAGGFGQAGSAPVGSRLINPGPIEANQQLRATILARINQAAIDAGAGPESAYAAVYAQALDDIAGLIQRFEGGQ